MFHVPISYVVQCSRSIYPHRRWSMKYRPIEGEVSKKDQERFWDKVDKKSSSRECWEWTAASRGGYTDDQYGVFRWNGRTVYAHRFSLYLVLGRDPGPTVDHLCFNTKCVNPQHLREATLSENSARQQLAIAEFCQKGHERTAYNTYIYPSGKRQCRECMRESWRKTYPAKYQRFRDKMGEKD